MLAFLTWMARIGAALAAAITALWIWGPYEPVDTDIAFDTSGLPDDLEAHLAAQEAQVPNLKPGVEKRILWHGAPGAQTDIAVVYIHGFSATSEEIRPVPDAVAKALNANLYFARLTGHGRDGPAMAEATVGAWFEDLAEAYAIGRRIGREVLVIATSTGGTLAAAGAVIPAVSADVMGYVFVSPNFELANPAGRLLAWPAARYWVPRVAGAERSFEAQNDAHAAFWSTSYPTVAALPMAALMKHVAGLSFGAVTSPALFMFSDEDRVVSAQATREVAAGWGGDVTLEVVRVGPEDDPYAHVIAGDILSPSQTHTAIDRIVAWARARGLE